VEKLSFTLLNIYEKQFDKVQFWIFMEAWFMLSLKKKKITAPFIQ